MLINHNKYTLNKGEVVGFETDTVWGLGCLPNDSEAVNKIYEIKGRDRTKPLILMGNSLESLMPYVLYVPDYAKTLMDKHFPGALTLIFQKSNLAQDFITSGKNTVGIRVPAHKEFQELCTKIDGNVLATTSLNHSSEPPVKDYDEACEKFSGKVTLIKPETPINTGVSSTVALCTGDKPVVLRQGNVRV